MLPETSKPEDDCAFDPRQVDDGLRAAIASMQDGQTGQKKGRRNMAALAQRTPPARLRPAQHPKVRSQLPPPLLNPQIQPDEQRH
ncbi:MAG: hypothetical protein HC875_35265 [Anaerolineales bacterium]|nr:hypothetical protein [Anaerolineales bacterium]